MLGGEFGTLPSRMTSVAIAPISFLLGIFKISITINVYIISLIISILRMDYYVLNLQQHFFFYRWQSLRHNHDNKPMYLEPQMGPHTSERHRRIYHATRRLQHEPQWRLTRTSAMYAFAAVAFTAQNPGIRESIIQFDTDSTPCGVDNRASGCMSDDP